MSTNSGPELHAREANSLPNRPAATQGRPRITIIGPIYPHRGGIAHYTACLAQALTDNGCDVQVVAFRRLYPRWLFPGRSEFDPSVRPAMFPAERVLGPVNPVRWFRALRTIKSFSPDLVVIAWWHSWLFPWTSFSLAWLRWLQRQRLALLCHNIRSHDHPAADGLAWSLLSRLPHTHIVHSSADPDRIRAMNPKANVVCLPHPAYEMFTNPKITKEEARGRLGLDAEDEVCLFFGLVRQYKGLDIAIEALGRLRDRPRLRLVIAGEFYDPQDPYVRQIRRLRLLDRVSIHANYIPNEDVAAYFRAADVLIAPYRSGSHSGVVQIARAMGLPVIAGDAGGMGDQVADGTTGLLVPTSDPASLAQAIGRFFEEGLADRFRRNLESQKDSFSWSQLAETVCRLAGGSC